MRLKQLTRKFKERKEKEPKPRFFSAIKSPLSTESKKRISDDNWIGAMKKYNNSTDSFQGDIHEVSGDIRFESKSKPKRFANLLLNKFDNTIHSSYFEAVLHGISEAYSNPKDSFNDPAIIVSVCKKSFDVYRDELGLSICWVMYKLGNSINRELYDIVKWYALNNSDIVNERRDLLNDGFNSVRGLAGSVIEFIIGNDKSAVDEFIPVINKLVIDESCAVRNCIIPAITLLLNYDTNLSVIIFLSTIENCDILIGSRFTASYLTYALQREFETLEPLIQKMLKQNDEEIVEVLTSNIWNLARFYDYAKKYCEVLRKGTEIQRIKSADVIASVLHDIDND